MKEKVVAMNEEQIKELALECVSSALDSIHYLGYMHYPGLTNGEYTEIENDMIKTITDALKEQT